MSTSRVSRGDENHAKEDRVFCNSLQVMTAQQYTSHDPLERKKPAASATLLQPASQLNELEPENLKKKREKKGKRKTHKKQGKKKEHVHDYLPIWIAAAPLPPSPLPLASSTLACAASITTGR